VVDVAAGRTATVLVEERAARDAWSCTTAPAALPPQATAAWLQLACAATGGRDVSRVVRTADGRPIGLPLVRTRSRGRSIDRSLPYGFGAAGVIGDEPPTSADLAAVVRELRAHGAARTHVRSTPADAAAWAEVPGVDRIAHRTHVLDLAPGWDAAWAGFSGKARTGVRKAERSGVVVEREADAAAGTETYLAVFREWTRAQAERSQYPAVLSRLAARRREPEHHYRLAARLLGDLYEVWVARIAGRPLAATLVLRNGPHAVQWRTASAPADAGPVRANEALISEIIRSLCERGVRTYLLGESGGKRSLEEFKEKFGAVAHDVPEIVVTR
jgi:hypothetical protein